MSVRELMKAFQSGQDPSKHKAGLFEHKSAKPKQPQEKGKVRAEKEKGQVPAQKETQKSESQTIKRGHRFPGAVAAEPRRGPRDASGRGEDAAAVKETAPGHGTPPLAGQAPREELEERGDRDPQISPDRRTSTDFSEVIKQELEANDRYQQFRRREEPEEAQLVLEQVLTSPFHTAFQPEPGSGELLPSPTFRLGGSCESLRHEGAAGSPCGSLMEGTPQVSSEESCKHEGLAETPETSPESLSSSPKKSREQMGSTLETDVHSGRECPSTKDTPVGAEEPGAAVAQGSEPGTGCVKGAAPDPSRETGPNPEGDGLGSCTLSSAKEAPAGLSEDTPCDDPPLAHKTQPQPGAQGLTGSEPLPPEAPARTGQTQASPRSPPGLELPLPRPDTEVLSPGADESLAVSHRDSLEASPVLEDNSSHKTPDSLEPSPLRESPCRDSLENSPVEPKMKAGVLPSHFPLPAAVAKTELFAEVASVRSRLLRDPDGSAEDDSLEQTSLVESSGKSPLSPDTPSSEEISYEVTPKASDAGTPKPAVIHECAEEEDSENGEKKRFTPEEEMFKMVTKIKTFDELEQEAKQKRDCRKEPKPDESASSEPDANGSADAGESPRGQHAEHGGGVPVVVAADRRKASFSSESEPEPTPPRAEADAGLLPEPVIHVQPPSPLPSSLDSSSSPEEGQPQPITPKQYTFKMNEDTQEEPGKSEGEGECDSRLPEDSRTGPTGSLDLAYDDQHEDANQPKICAGHGCEAGHPSSPAMPVSSGPRGPPGADVCEERVTRHDPSALRDPAGRGSEGEALDGSRVASPQADCPSEGSSSLSSGPDCPASEGKESAEAIVSPSSVAKMGVTKTDPASESLPKGCPTLDSAIPSQIGRLCTDMPGSDPAETEESYDLQIISPYENVPPQSFFSSEESKTQTDARHTSFHSSEVYSVTVASSVEGVVVAHSSSGTVSSKESTFGSQSMEMESTQERTLWETRSESAPASLEGTLPSSSAAVGEHASKVVITTTVVDSDSWSEIREDDEAFEARVKEEEQKVFGLMADRQSQGTTPDTTPARTPTEEGTPTSEQNPFLFQEGKLFEMTRSGAIDMTKRSYADESFHFFQIGQECREETASEDVTEGGAAAEPSGPETPAQSLARPEPKDTDEADLLPDDLSEEGEGTPASDGHLRSQKGIPASMDMPGKEAAPVGTADLPPMHGDDAPPPSSMKQTAGPTCAEPTVQAQLDFSTVTRSVYSDRDDDSPDSSPEEQRSVIEIPTAPTGNMPPESRSEIPVRTAPTATPALPPAEEERDPPEGVLLSPDEDRREQETKPKSKIPVKAPLQGVRQPPSHPDTSLPETVAPREEGMPGGATDDRSTPESEASPLDSKSRHPVKTRSCTETEAESGGRAEGLVLEPEEGAARPRAFASRLPVKSRSTSSSCRGAPSPTREGKEHFFDLYRNSIEFFEEISDEASKLVDRLTQSEREQEVVSDDESSSALEVSVIETLQPTEPERSVSEDVFDTRPIWDESIETLIERIPDENGRDHAEDQQDEQEHVEERLAYIADHLGFSWTELARELDFTEEQIHQIRVENPNSLQDQSHALLKYWLERDGKLATDTILIECLTKINRMDIVHLMETSTEPRQERTSPSYAEMEQSITLEHSEGFSVLQDELPARPRHTHGHAATREGESCGPPPIVSDEDLSVGYSSFQDCTPRTDGDSSAAELFPQARQEQVRPEEPAAEQPQERLATAPGTEGSDTEKAAAAPGSPSGTPEEDRPREPADTPIVQEPEEPPELREGGSLRKNSLVIVESTDEQPLAFESLDEDSAFQKELVAELGGLEASSDDEATVTTRVVRRRVIIQGDDVPDMPPETVTEEKYVDEHGHTVVKKVTRKVIRRYVASDGTEKEEVTVQGQPQEPVSIEDGDGYSKVIKRVVLKSDTKQSEVALSEPGVLCEASQFQAEPVEGRRVSKVVKTTVVRGERMEKHLGDPRLALDLPSAKDDFEEDDAQ